MSMKVIALTAEKGGVGKTTLSTYLAVYLAIKGFRVLFLDTEQQMNAAAAFGFEATPDFYDLIQRGKPWQEVIRRVPAQIVGSAEAKLYTILGNEETRHLNNHPTIRTRILERLAEVSELFDYCVIDSSPTLGELHKGIYLASHHILIPTDLEPFAVYNGIPATQAHTANIRKIAVEAGFDTGKILGIVPNRYRAATTLHTQFLAVLKEAYGALVWDGIPLATAIPESQNRQEFLFAAQPELRITQALREFGDRVIAESGGIHE